MLFAASRAPSGSNRQPFRFIVLTDGPKAQQAKELIATGARQVWSGKKSNDGYDQGSGTVENSPKARMAATMQRYTDEFERVPVLVLPCLRALPRPHPVRGGVGVPGGAEPAARGARSRLRRRAHRFPRARRTRVARIARDPRGRVHGRHDHHRQA